MTEDDITAFNTHYYELASKLSCPVLRENYLKVSQSIAFQSFGKTLMECNPSADLLKSLSGLELDQHFIIGCYNDISADLEGRFMLSRNTFPEILETIELLASIYVSLMGTQFMRPVFKQMMDSTSKLVESLDQATVNWDEEMEYYERLFYLISINRNDAKKYSDAMKSLIEARDQIRKLPDFIKHSAIARACEFGKRAQPTNMPLQIWVEAIYSLWVNRLGRSIENKNDGVNGRKHLLDFMEALMLPVHEAIEYSTLDNMLRKVQRDVEARGGFNHPDFRLGVSVPIGVGWSKPES